MTGPIATPQETPGSLVGMLVAALRGDRARRKEEEKENLLLEGQRLANQRTQQQLTQDEGLYPFRRVQEAHAAGRELLPATVTVREPADDLAPLQPTLRAGYTTESPAFRIRGLKPQTAQDLLPKGPHVTISPERIVNLDQPEEGAEETGYGVDEALGLPRGASKLLGGRAVDLLRARRPELFGESGLRLDDVRQIIALKVNALTEQLRAMRESSPEAARMRAEIDGLTAQLIEVVSPSQDLSDDELAEFLIEQFPDLSDEELADRARRLRQSRARGRAIRGSLRDLQPRRSGSLAPGTTVEPERSRESAASDLGPRPRFGSSAFGRRP